MCVCLCACLCVCMCLFCVCVCVFVCVCMCVYVCVCVWQIKEAHYKALAHYYAAMVHRQLAAIYGKEGSHVGVYYR